MKKGLILIITTVVLAGCSPLDLLAKFAGNENEQAAQEAYERSKIAEEKLQAINTKKQNYPDSVDLLKVNENDGIAAVAFRDTRGQKMIVEIEALLTDPKNQLYEAWLKSSEGKYQNLGALEYRRTDDYGLKVEVDSTFKTYPTILITRESVPDATPETVIMTGAFKATSPEASPAAQKP